MSTKPHWHMHPPQGNQLENYELAEFKKSLTIDQRSALYIGKEMHKKMGGQLCKKFKQTLEFQTPPLQGERKFRVKWK